MHKINVKKKVIHSCNKPNISDNAGRGVGHIKVTVKKADCLFVFGGPSFKSQSGGSRACQKLLTLYRTAFNLVFVPTVRCLYSVAQK